MGKSRQLPPEMLATFALLALGRCAALQLSTRSLRFGTVPMQLRTKLVMETAASETAASDEQQCALIGLSAEDPLRLAKVLKKAWMEGGVKRGLVGSVLVCENQVMIACQGPPARLQSFAHWIESNSMLVTSVEMMGADLCPADTLTKKFPLAEAESWSDAKPGSFSGALAEILKSLSVNIDAKEARLIQTTRGSSERCK